MNKGRNKKKREEEEKEGMSDKRRTVIFEFSASLRQCCAAKVLRFSIQNLFAGAFMQMRIPFP